MDTSLRIVAFAALGWTVFLIAMIGYRSKIPSLGKPPIPWPALALAKIAVGISFLMMFRAAVAGSPRLSVLAAAVFLLLLIGGMAVFSAALLTLGRNLRVGLPGEKTELVTSGVYRFSRNPVYVAIFSMMGASLIYAFSWINALAVATGILLHHLIILSEEQFLNGRFPRFEAYRRRVRRYF
jgi:protein-S-isoprenylcysteine O-methyltransferase Ste14